MGRRTIVLTATLVATLTMGSVVAAAPAIPQVNLVQTTGGTERQAVQGLRDNIKSLCNRIAKIVFKAAWPTAHFSSWQLTDVDREDDGAATFTVRLTGTSAWTGDTIWLDGIVRVNRELRVRSLRWGDYHAFVRPGTAAKILRDLLDDE